MKTSFLGKSSKGIKKSGRNLLDSISRIKEDINYGSDIWNVYDFMYLDKNKIPALNVLEISIPSKSGLIIESKSMKLYLNSFYNKSFKSKTEIVKKKLSCESGDDSRKTLVSRIACDLKSKVKRTCKTQGFCDILVVATSFEMSM